MTTTFSLPPIPKWNVEELTGYKPQTTFWQDFSIAEKFGTWGVQGTFNRAFKEWRGNRIYCTELCYVLNWKAWQWNDIDPFLSSRYAELYERVYDWAIKHFKGEDLQYFLDTLD